MPGATDTRGRRPAHAAGAGARGARTRTGVPESHGGRRRRQRRRGGRRRLARGARYRRTPRCWRSPRRATARGATALLHARALRHIGRTPPCTERVDRGRGRARRRRRRGSEPRRRRPGLRALAGAGIDVATGVLEEQARRLNEAFERHVRTGLPFVTLKIGGIARRQGGRPRRHVQVDLRRGRARRRARPPRRGGRDRRSGAGTALADDPALDSARRAATRAARRSAWSSTRPAGSRPTGDRSTGGAHPRRDHRARRTARAPTRGHAGGAEVVAFDATSGGVSLPELMATWASATCKGCCWKAGRRSRGASSARPRRQGRRCISRRCSSAASDAPGCSMGAGFARSAEAAALRIVQLERIGDDLRVEADVHRDR